LERQKDFLPFRALPFQKNGQSILSHPQLKDRGFNPYWLYNDSVLARALPYSRERESGMKMRKT
jgi:hypothetical protein